MGKKSKRNRGNKKSDSSTITSPPALRSSGIQEEETVDNLQFEDPYVDTYEEEFSGPDNHQSTGGDELVQLQTLNPYHATKEPLEMDPSAYKMHFSLQGEWPSLSFDFVHDTWGHGRTRFPHRLLAVVGTQADLPENNSLQTWKLSDLGRLEKDVDDDDEIQEYDANNDSEDSDSDIDYDPVFEHCSVKHQGGINRVRTHQGIVATWSETRKINLYTMDVEGLCSDNLRPPAHFYTYAGHSTEGYALDFSPGGRLATGDNDGAIHIFASDYQSAQPMYTTEQSVEDIQWSPNEPTVLAAAESGGLTKVYDIRAPNRSMLTKDLGNKSDVNALAWSSLVTNLLGSGSDDGAWSVWDLRKFEEPLARFTSHTTPITSMEWHPTDESMIIVSDDVGSFIYDLSVEEEEAQKQGEVNDLPPQLLFVHSGSPMTKEVHWHPQISSCLMSTAIDGFHVFIPSNL